MKTPQSKRRGQGLVEYILVVCVMGIATIAVISVFGDNVRRLYAMSADALAGEQHVAMANQATAVQRVQLSTRSLRNFAANDGY